MLRTLITGTGTGIAAALFGTSLLAPVTGAEIKCDGYAWPNYPPACLTTADGEALAGRSVRAAVSYPPAPQRLRTARLVTQPELEVTLPDLPRVPAIEPPANDLAPAQPEHRHPEPSGGNTVVVWRNGEPTVYALAGL